MTSVVGDWQLAWRFDRWGSMVPEQVEILPAGKDFVLVKGEDHTQYKGGFFSTAEAAMDHAIEEEKRSLESSKRRLANLERAKERYRKSKIS